MKVGTKVLASFEAGMNSPNLPWHHRQPKLRLRAAHKLDCFFHAIHNTDIGNI